MQRESSLEVQNYPTIALEIKLKQPEQKNIINSNAMHYLITKKYKGKPIPKPIIYKIKIYYQFLTFFLF